MIIRIDDMRRAGHCVRGVRGWFATHGLDFRDFLENGIEADQLVATGDALAERVVKLAEERRGG